jgi:positive regulator of sigma E activity
MKDTLVIILGSFGIALVVMLFLGLPTMLLWNWLMPEIFGLKEISFFQAIGIQILAYLVFPSKSNPSKSNK